MTNLTHNSFPCIYFSSLHVSSNPVLIIRKINYINTISGTCHYVSVTISCAGKELSDLHTKRSPTQSDHVPKVVLIYRLSQEEWTKLRESVPYVKIYRYNPKHLYPKLNGYGDNGHRKVWASGGPTFCTPSVTPYSSTAHARQRDIVMQ